MRALIVIAALAFAFDLAVTGTLIDPPTIFAIEVAFAVGWGVACWRARPVATVRWIVLATGAVALFGPLRGVLFNWCLLTGQCVA